MAENKTAPTAASVQGFLSSIEDAERRADAQALCALLAEASGEAPVMWGPSIVGFGSYAYAYESGRKGSVPLVSFSPRKANLVLYIVPGFSEYGALLARLGKHKTGKSCLYLNRLADADLDVLCEMAARSAAAMRAKAP
jgi:hypothetical protein